MQMNGCSESLSQPAVPRQWILGPEASEGLIAEDACLEPTEVVLDSMRHAKELSNRRHHLHSRR